MRKKSHIALAKFIVSNSEEIELNQHRRAFYFGNIFPDLKPSFLTTKHEFNITFDNIREEIFALCNEDFVVDHSMTVFTLRLGEVLHFLADYFTFPHNEHYSGNMKDHCIYESELKKRLRSYIGEYSVCVRDEERRLSTPEGLCSFIEYMHNEYLKKEGGIENDCRYIISVCYLAAESIINMAYLGEMEIEYRMAV